MLTFNSYETVYIVNTKQFEPKIFIS